MALAGPDGFFRTGSRQPVRPYTRQLSLWFSIGWRERGRMGHMIITCIAPRGKNTSYTVVVVVVVVFSFCILFRKKRINSVSFCVMYTCSDVCVDMIQDRNHLTQWRGTNALYTL